MRGYKQYGWMASWLGAENDACKYKPTKPGAASWIAIACVSFFVGKACLEVGKEGIFIAIAFIVGLIAWRIKEGNKWK